MTLSPATVVAGSTLVLLTLGEQFLQLGAGAAAYGAAWWLLRRPHRAER